MAKITFLSVSFLYILCFSIILLIDVTRGESLELNNETASVMQEWRSDRSKRSIFTKMPLYLKMKIENEMGQRIDLKWKKQPHSLANKHLPITYSNGHQIRKVMKDIGEFVVYHDLSKCSAVVYFDKTKTLSGSIGLEFTITDLPYEFDDGGNYLGTEAFRYISRRQNRPLHNLPQIPDVDLNDLFAGCDRNPHDDTNSQFNPQPGPSWSHDIKRRQTPKVFKLYYLEILVFVTRDVTDMYKYHYHGEIACIRQIVKDYIIYFNIIDMVFQKLATFYEAVQLNIAKIVIEDGSLRLDVSTNDGKLLFENTVARRRENLAAYQHFYPRDSYDYVFISTSRPIEANSILVPGATDYEADLYRARQLGRWFKAVPVTIMGYYEYPVLTVHEIGRTFNMEVDPWNKGQNSAGQCYAIMQQGSSKCQNCLKWSKESSDQFKLFFRENRNRCFLMNEPRALRRKSVSQFFTLTKMCQCFGYDSVVTGGETTFQHGYIQQENCNEPLPCSKTVDGLIIEEDTITPFDGTLCGGKTRVCWNDWCTLITYGFSSADEL